MIKDNFFGRTEYLNILEKRALDLKEGYRQNIAITGDELVGKTAIIHKFLNVFCDNRVILLYLEVRPESLNSFIRRFIGVLLYNFLSVSGIPLREDLEFLLSKSDKYIPKTVEKIRNILVAMEKRKKVNIFTDLLSLTESIHQETGKFSVIIFDEFHNLEHVGFNNLYKEWSKLLIIQKSTLHVIISSLKFKAHSILSRNLSLLFGNFEVINVEPFDTRDAEIFLNLNLKGPNLDKGLENFIVHFTGGYPFYLKLVGNSLLKPDKNHLADILENLLFDSSGALNQRFSNYLKRFSDSAHENDLISLLYLISNGRNKIKDIAHVLKKTQKELNADINRLLEADTITKSGDFLKINDRVFGFWLKFVYQEKLQSLTFDAQNQKKKFRDHIEDMIEEFLLAAQKSISQRLTELMRLFEDETFLLERKRVRLNHFREVKQFEFNSKTLKDGLIGRSNDSLWIMAVKREILTEEDVTDFAKECKKYRHKLQRKIIITLSDIDTNARLRALEEKIWTWDANNLNQILDLFYKPRVII
ncbi:MAG: ATP-binding protein [Candidatus Omnitrophota bacterium]|jgi:hypothetical protein